MCKKIDMRRKMPLSVGRRKRSENYAASNKKSKNSHTIDSPCMQSLLKMMDEYEKRAPEEHSLIFRAFEVVLDNDSFQKAVQKNKSKFVTCADSVAILDKAWEESMMREPYLPEDKECIMGGFCEARYVGNIPDEEKFTAVAFVFPQLDTAPTDMCIFCMRKTTQLLFYKIVSGGLKSNSLIQMYGNRCNEPNQYHSSVMNIIPPLGPVHCMPVPTVAHQRNRYCLDRKDIVLENGCTKSVRFIKQINVDYENFQ